MPVRRRQNKRRSTEGLEQWTFVFHGGFDYFRELAALGIDLDEHGRPSRNDVEAAWCRLGDAFLESLPTNDRDEPWALREFGAPGDTGKRRLRRGR